MSIKPRFVCLFDMDGLLINTEDMYTLASNEILKPYNKTVSNELKLKLMGLREIESIPLFLKETNIPLTVSQYKELRDLHQNKLFLQCLPKEGVLELVSKLKNNNIPICLASSSLRESYLIKSKNNYTLFNLFGDNIVLGDMVVNSKPAPDTFIKAFEVLGVSDVSVYVFEDSVIGVRAGLNAKYKVIWVRSEEFASLVEVEEREKLEKQCFLVLRTLKDFDIALLF